MKFDVGDPPPQQFIVIRSLQGLNGILEKKKKEWWRMLKTSMCTVYKFVYMCER
jgi:hypothetical protein